MVPSIAVLAALLFWLWSGRYVTTENAYVKAHIAQISAEVAGRIQEVHVHDHADVKAGDILFTLDQEPFRVALAKAEAELDSIRSQVRTLIATWHEAKSELQEAESKVAYWNAQLARQKTLAERGIVSSSKFEEVENNAVAAADRVSVVRKKVERVATQLIGDPERPVDEHPMVREKQAERERAELELSRTVIRAPLGGTAVNVKLQKGEQIKAATTLFALVSHTRPWVEANFKETELTHVTERPHRHRGARHLPGRGVAGGGREHQPGDRRRVRAAAAAERVGQLGQGGAAPARAGAPAAPARRAAAARRHDRHRQGRHRARAPPEPAVRRLDGNGDQPVGRFRLPRHRRCTPEAAGVSTAPNSEVHFQNPVGCYERGFGGSDYLLNGHSGRGL